MRSALAILSALWLSAAVPAAGQPPSPAAGQPPLSGAPDATSRGEYIVHRVAMCVQCHSERDDTGRLFVGGLLQGARMPVRSPFPGQSWAFSTPKLAGLPSGYSEAQLSIFLQTGDSGRGRPPRPPMPPFRMTAADATAVVAYLKSLR